MRILDEHTCEFRDEDAIHQNLDEICPNFASAIRAGRIYVYKLMFVSNHHLFSIQRAQELKKELREEHSFDRSNLHKGSKMLG